jgi:hypothetical protein
MNKSLKVTSFGGPKKPPNLGEVMFNIVYKTLGFKWLNQAFCPASAFVSADRNEDRNPQRFIHATVTAK